MSTNPPHGRRALDPLELDEPQPAPTAGGRTPRSAVPMIVAALLVAAIIVLVIAL